MATDRNAVQTIVEMVRDDRITAKQASHPIELRSQMRRHEWMDSHLSWLMIFVVWLMIFVPLLLGLFRWFA